MGNLIIKGKGGAGNKLILQDQAGGAVLTTADSGATIASGVISGMTGIPAAGVTGTLPNAVQDNVTRLGTVTAGTMASTVQLEDPAVTGWFCSLSGNVDINSAAILDFDTIHFMGSSNSESGGTITVGTAGFYQIAIEVSARASNDDTMEFYCYKNGALFSNRLYVSSQGEFQYPQASTHVLVELAANDTIAWHGTGDLYGAALPNPMCVHSGFRVGK